MPSGSEDELPGVLIAAIKVRLLLRRVLHNHPHAGRDEPNPAKTHDTSADSHEHHWTLRMVHGFAFERVQEPMRKDCYEATEEQHHQPNHQICN